MSAAAAGAVGATLPTGKTGDYVKAFIWVAVAILVIVIVVMAIKQGSKIFESISGGIDKFLISLGLKDSAEKEKANADLSQVDDQANSTNSPFNPTYYKSVPAGTKIKTAGSASDIATQVYNSVGVIYDDPEAAYGAFKQCSNWAMVSQICDRFNQLYKKDCYDWLKIKFDTTKQKDTLAKIVKYCFELPKLS